MPETAPDAAPEERLIRLWDLPTRLFHWLLASLIGLEWLGLRTSLPLPAGWLAYGVLVLVIWRLGWGWLGSPTARFASFLRPPHEVAAYARRLLHGEHYVSFGHNPLGGWSVVLMLAFTALQAATMHGLAWTRVPDAEFALVHRASLILLLGAIVLHIGAVFLHVFVAEDDLVTPMLSGRKRVPPSAAAAERTFAGNGRAFALLAGVAVMVWLLARP